MTHASILALPGVFFGDTFGRGFAAHGRCDVLSLCVTGRCERSVRRTK